MEKRISLISAIRKWGNSPALRLPLPLLKVAHFSLEQKVTVTAEKGRLTIEPVAKTDYQLSDLIDGISEENSPELIDFGPAVGKELL
jgi:antitoxin MazE